MDVRLPDGTVLRGVPDGTTKADIVAKLQASGREIPADWLPSATPAAASAPTARQELLSGTPMRVAKGMSDPIQGGAQLLSRVPGAQYVNRAADAVGGAINRLIGAKGDFAGEVLGIRGATPAQLDAETAAAEQEYQAARRATAPVTLSTLVTGLRDPGTDWARMAGNVISPANAAIARALPVAGATVGSRAGVGAAGGTLAALSQPVTDAGDGEYGHRKLAQVAGGAAAGALAAPVVGAIGDRVAQWASNRLAARAATRAPNPQEVEAIARRVANDTQQVWEDLGPQQQAQMRDQVAQAMQAAGGRRDPAALARQADFAAEGMQGTLGQVTRDPRQFANEMNLRQLPGTGDPLLQRFQQQGQQLQEKVGALGRGAQQAYPAGNSLMTPLRAYDERLSSDIRAAYRAARDSAGKDAELPLQGLAQDAADVIDNFGDKLPSGVVNQLRKYGILPNQAGLEAPRKLFTVEEADKLLKVINASGSRTDDATNAALSQLRGAVKRAVSEPGADDVFAPARRLAAERFGLHDSVDALAAVARGRASPDTFVDRFVLGADTDQAARLADILRRESPDAFQQARAQIGAKLGRAAFGENVAGDKPFAAERFAAALRDLGDDKLAAFFSPAEVERLHRLSRIGAYVNQAPNRAPINSSGNWAAIQSVAARIPGVGPVLALARSAQTAVANQTGVGRAVAAEIPVQPAQVDPAAVARLSQLLGPVGVGAGAATGGAIK